MQRGKYYKHINMVDVCLQVIEILGDEMEIVWWITKTKTVLADDRVPVPKNLDEWYEVIL